MSWKSLAYGLLMLPAISCNGAPTAPPPVDVDLPQPCLDADCEDVLDDLLRMGASRKGFTAADTEVLTIAPGIYQVQGYGNTQLVHTSDGDVLIDTASKMHARIHRRLLAEISDAPVRTIVITHGHNDHHGGVRQWLQEGTEVIQQREAVPFMNYEARMHGRGNHGAKIPATRLFDQEYAFEVGDRRFEVHHTPGETPDALSVWMPEERVAFVGDLFYVSFPNLYTIRGETPRSAMDWSSSIQKVIDWHPEILVPSHGEAIYGADEIERRLTRYRDAILYVHDETVRGMLKGDDVHTLMQRIRLPDELALVQGYGRVEWSVRGIFEGYKGWYDGRAATLLAVPAESVYPDLVELAGGPEVVARRSLERLAAGQPEEALHLAEVAIAADDHNPEALKARLAALEELSRYRDVLPAGAPVGRNTTGQNVYRNEELAQAIEKTRKRLGNLDSP